MRRTSAKDRARSRILADDEIRAVWEAADGTFGDMVRLLLLDRTTPRQGCCYALARYLDRRRVGRSPRQARKGVGGALILPELAIEIIRSRPSFASNPYVFAGRGGSHLSGYSKAKAQLDAKAPLPEWRLHDLRRTARSLMSRAGVRPDIAERVLGHAIRACKRPMIGTAIAARRPTH